VPKFAQINLLTFVFNDPMPKSAEKCQFFAIFDFANVQKMLQQVTQLQCVYPNFSQLI